MSNWSAPAWANAVRANATRFNNTAPRLIDLTGDKTTFTEDVGRLTTCYQLSGTTERLNGADADPLWSRPETAFFMANGASGNVAPALDRLRTTLAPNRSGSAQ